MTTIDWIVTAYILIVTIAYVWTVQILLTKLERYSVAADMWKELAISQKKELDGLVEKMNKPLNSHDNN